MVRRLRRYVRNRAWRLRFQLEGWRGAGRLRRLVPGLADYPRLAARAAEQLRPAYGEYVAGVSNDAMAASLEASVFLHALTTVRRPRSILDLGSGFSSYTFRRAVAELGSDAAICSVDDDREWLARTETFLTAHGVAAGHLCTWSELVASGDAGFDLIFYDLGSIATRIELLPAVLGLLAGDGLLILDDMHKIKYRIVAVPAVERAGLIRCSARGYTLDRFDRFAEVALGAAPHSSGQRAKKPSFHTMSRS